MERDWRDFKSLYGNIAGARTAFEQVCEDLLRAMHPTSTVQQVEVKQGDGGIDVFIGDIGQAPISVYQCKFFLESFGNSQHGQIATSFKSAIESELYSMLTWVLCLPIVLDIDQHLWWSNWRKKQIDKYGLAENAIKLINGNELIMLLKTHGIYNTAFKIDEAMHIESTQKMVAEIHEKLISRENPVAVELDSDPNKVLFNNYTPAAEAYYLTRDSDKKFCEKMKSGNIWLYGPSGCGKTAMVNRNLISIGADYIYCDYSPIDITSVNDILDELIACIKDNYASNNSEPLLTSATENRIKTISALLVNNAKQRPVFIVIDELSISDLEMQKAFANALVQLAIYHLKKPGSGFLKFIISTIPEPLNIISDKPKASAHFQYLSANDWNEDIGRLLELLTKSLNLEISVEGKGLILSSAGNNPRLLKNILKKTVSCLPLDETKIKYCIEESISEYF